jgi:hypothetical protein
MSGVNIMKYMPSGNIFKNANIPTSKSLFGDVKGFNYNKSTTGATSSTSPTTIKQFSLGFLSYTLAILIVIIVLLLFVHFLITPVFKFKPGGPGIISIPIIDDGTLYWKDNKVGEILDKDTPIAGISYNYSMTMDIMITEPMNFANTPRILFTRGANKKPTPTTDTLLGMFTNYNLVVALEPDTNDMIISILNSDNNMENAFLKNVPVQTPFRLGIIVMEHAMEVYVNGRLSKTRAFATVPMASHGPILPPQATNASTAKIRNLKIWKRLLTAPEVRESKPALYDGK